MEKKKKIKKQSLLQLLPGLSSLHKIFSRKFLWAELYTHEIIMLKSQPLAPQNITGLLRSWLRSWGGILILLWTGNLGTGRGRGKKTCEDSVRRRPSTSQGERPQRKPALPIPWSQISSLQNRERRNVSSITQFCGPKTVVYTSVPNFSFFSTYFTQAFCTVPPKVLLSMSRIILKLDPDDQSTFYLTHFISNVLLHFSLDAYVTTLAWFSSNPRGFFLNPLYVGMSCFLDVFCLLLTSFHPGAFLGAQW